ncbi:MAG: CDP-diacylglycerol--serine O-phosphatidyltransferase [Mailhella sp.]|nr:CDP-diacylglycerol--serine O-phosphatidyltransferase [Mailhella sp.]
MEHHKSPSRGVYVLPNLFTASSMFAAFLSMTNAMGGRFTAAAYCIFISALLDGLDGKVARLTHTASRFGVEFDSLADQVAFGVAPAVLAWTWQLNQFGRLGAAVAFLYAVCAGMRLARFNVDVGVVSKKFFIGLPSPASGCLLPAFMLFIPYLPDFLAARLPHVTLILCIVAPLLMVTRIRYFSFKEYGFIQAHPFRILVAAVMLLVLLLTYPSFWLFMTLFVYVLSGMVYTGWLAFRSKDRLFPFRKKDKNAANEG